MSAAAVWNFLLWIYYLALSVWVGGIAFLAAIAAPSIHGSMASRAIAGEIVGKMLSRFNLVELTCCFILLTVCWAAFRFVSGNKQWLWIVIVVLLIMGAVTSFYAFHLAPQMHALKENTPVFETLTDENPARQHFNNLHHTYVRLMALNLILGVAVLYGSVVTFK